MLMKIISVFLIIFATTWPVVAAPQSATEKVEGAIASVKGLERKGRDVLATVWDGNKYVQCRRLNDKSLRCEAAGTLMQPSLARVLTPDRIGRLAATGWMLDPSFGNYVQTFAAGKSAKDVAERIIAALSEAYAANLDTLEIETKSIKSESCPPRNGPTQNLAGLINDAPSMRVYAVHACSYRPDIDEPDTTLNPGSTIADLIGIYGPKITAEFLRLRVNMHRHVFTVFDTGLGYVQCQPQTEPDAFYCEAQSAESWPALSAVLMPDRIARLHAAGFADPGRAPNYSKTFPADTITDASMTAEILTILHEVYGYYGASKLEVKTEED